MYSERIEKKTTTIIRNAIQKMANNKQKETKKILV